MFNFLPVGHLVRQGGGFCSLSGLSTKGCAGEDKKDNGKNSEQSSALGCRASFRGRYVHDFFCGAVKGRCLVGQRIGRKI